MSLKENVFHRSPYLVQNIAITLFNSYQYKIRHGGNYKKFRKYYKKADQFDEKRLEKELNKRKLSFFKYVQKNSIWYSDYNFKDFSKIDILEKKDIVSNLNEIKTLDEEKGLVNLTSGSTGASMKTVFTRSDMQERFAILDHFKSKHGFSLGKKTAWFSGKNLITENHIKNNICSHYDFHNKIRFYSTFHISKKNFNIYWNSLNKFQPDFIVGFPSSVFEICEIADSFNLRLSHKVKVFFTTSETVLPQHREVINRVLGCKLVDQYASSEGAPFMAECKNGNMHINPLTGIFEVVDEYMQPSTEGEILVTSFTTRGTPLVRYRIGDRIKMAPRDKRCDCGSLFPIVESIEGRTKEFIYSPERGRINLVNLGNSTKGLKGIICFQVIQDVESEVLVKMVVTNDFNKSQEEKFISALRDRVGEKISINIQYVENIPREKGGKFCIVKNNLVLEPKY